jgi:DNA-directed RNA polymerase subunit RPC12/RpoP
MSFKQQLKELFRTRQWLTLDQIHEVGGHDATRAIRKLREEGWKIDMRREYGRTEYRFSGEEPKAEARYRHYACARCGKSGPDPQFTHTHDGVVCPRCGSPVKSYLSMMG